MCFRLNLIDISPNFFVGAENLSLHVVIAVFSHRHRQVNTISLAKSACVTLGYCYCCKWYNYFKTLRYFFPYRYLYLRKFVIAKLIYNVFLVISFHLFMFFIVPLVTQRYVKERKKNVSRRRNAVHYVSLTAHISFDIVALSSVLSTCQMQTLYITCSLVCQRLSGSSVRTYCEHRDVQIRTYYALNPYIYT